MATTCNPETLSSQIECYLCIKGERTSEAVKTWLLRQYMGNSQTPEQLWQSATAAGFGKLTLKQASQAIVYSACLDAGGSCTPESLNANAVAFQKFSWQQNQAAIIYFLATGLTDFVPPEKLVASAASLGFQNLPIKAQRQIQAYLLSDGLTPEQLNVATECFQCLGETQLLAMENYAYCSLTGGFVVNSAQFPLIDGTAQSAPVLVSTKPQYMRMVLHCTAPDMNGFYNWFPGDEFDCFGIFDNSSNNQPFACFYQSAGHGIVLQYNGDIANNMRYSYGTNQFSAVFEDMTNFSMKVYYF